MWVRYPSEWAGLLRTAIRRAAEDPWRADAALAGSGVSRWSVDQEVPDDPDAFLCGTCDRWFPAVGGAVQHRIRAHGIAERSSIARACCVASTCPACGSDFRSRIRALRHLVHGARSCVEACGPASLQPCNPFEVEAADERDRRERALRRRIGLRDVSGLPFLLA